MTRDPKKWVMSLKPGIGYIALESSRRLGRQVPIFCAVTWAPPASTNGGPGRARTWSCCTTSNSTTPTCLPTWTPGAREPPADKVSELTMRVFRRMNEVMEAIRGERMPRRRILGLPQHAPPGVVSRIRGVRGAGSLAHVSVAAHMRTTWCGAPFVGWRESRAYLRVG